MANPLEQSLRDARRMNRGLGHLFDRHLGSTRHPRGRILSAYRQARLAMMSAYRDTGPMASINRLSVVGSLRLNVHQFMGEALDDAIEIGQDSADRQWAH